MGREGRAAGRRGGAGPRKDGGASGPAAPPGVASERRALRWLDDYERVSRWMRKWSDLEARLEAGGGLAVLPDFYPDEVARAARGHLERLPASRWLDTSASRDARRDDIDHAFWSAKSEASDFVSSLLRATSAVLPGELSAFSVARYGTGHRIAPHDDRARAQVLMDDGGVAECSRDVALIVHLVPDDWSRDDGGALLDLGNGSGGEAEPGRPRAGGSSGVGGDRAGGHGESEEGRTNTGVTTIVPRFNVAVAFRVPRMHEVTPVAERFRHSVFGWFLVPGRTYALESEEVSSRASGKVGARVRGVEEDGGAEGAGSPREGERGSGEGEGPRGGLTETEEEGASVGGDGNAGYLPPAKIRCLLGERIARVAERKRKRAARSGRSREDPEGVGAAGGVT